MNKTLSALALFAALLVGAPASAFAHSPSVTLESANGEAYQDDTVLDFEGGDDLDWTCTDIGQFYDPNIIYKVSVFDPGFNLLTSFFSCSEQNRVDFLSRFGSGASTGTYTVTIHDDYIAGNAETYEPYLYSFITNPEWFVDEFEVVVNEGNRP